MKHESEPISDSTEKWIATHVRRYVETDGKVGHIYHGMPTLLLITRGRRTGQLRRTALIYGLLDDHDQSRYLVVASNGGSPFHPAWYLNLLANPDVAVQVGAEKFAARARPATSEEKPALWDTMVSIFPIYATYQAKAGREIPVVVLVRSG